MLNRLVSSVLVAASLLSFAVPASAEYYVSANGKTKYTIVRDAHNKPIHTIVKRQGKEAVYTQVKRKSNDKDPLPKKIISSRDRGNVFIPQPNPEPSGTGGTGTR